MGLSFHTGHLPAFSLSFLLCHVYISLCLGLCVCPQVVSADCCVSKADSDCTIATITGMDASCHQVDVSATFYQGGEDNVVTHHLFQLTLECIPELNDPGVLFAMDRGNALRSAKNGLAPQSLFYAYPSLSRWQAVAARSIFPLQECTQHARA